MKKWIVSIVALLLTLLIALPVGAAQSVNTNVYYNGEKLTLSEAPFIEKGKTYVPLRSYFQELDYEVTYSSATKSIMVKDQDLQAIIDLKSKSVVKNDEIVVESLDLIFRNNTYYAPIKELQSITDFKIVFQKAQNAILLTDSIKPEEVIEASQGFLWKVTNGSTEVYLLGSIHVGDEELYPLREEIDRAFAESDILVTEVDTTKELSKEEKNQIESLFIYQDGTTLRDHISPLTYVQVKALAKKYELDMDVIDEYNAWFLSMLFEELIPANEEISSEHGIDLHFLEAAKEKKIPNLELETAYSQYKMLSSFSDEYQESQLQYTLEKIKYYNLGYDVNEGDDYLLNIWKEGTLEYLDEMSIEIKKSDLEYYNGMLTNRNKGMTDKIVSYLNEGNGKTYFVIAGAMHFAGPDSIIVMLEEHGYTVERL